MIRNVLNLIIIIIASAWLSEATITSYSKFKVDPVCDNGSYYDLDLGRCAHCSFLSDTGIRGRESDREEVKECQIEMLGAARYKEMQDNPAKCDVEPLLAEGVNATCYTGVYSPNNMAVPGAKCLIHCHDDYEPEIELPITIECFQCGNRSCFWNVTMPDVLCKAPPATRTPTHGSSTTLPAVIGGTIGVTLLIGIVVVIKCKRRSLERRDMTNSEISSNGRTNSNSSIPSDCQVSASERQTSLNSTDTGYQSAPGGVSVGRLEVHLHQSVINHTVHTNLHARHIDQVNIQQNIDLERRQGTANHLPSSEMGKLTGSNHDGESSENDSSNDAETSLETPICVHGIDAVNAETSKPGVVSPAEHSVLKESVVDDERILTVAVPPTQHLPSAITNMNLSATCQDQLCEEGAVGGSGEEDGSMSNLPVCPSNPIPKRSALSVIPSDGRRIFADSGYSTKLTMGSTDNIIPATSEHERSQASLAQRISQDDVLQIPEHENLNLQHESASLEPPIEQLQQVRLYDHVKSSITEHSLQQDKKIVANDPNPSSSLNAMINSAVVDNAAHNFTDIQTSNNLSTTEKHLDTHHASTDSNELKILSCDSSYRHTPQGNSRVSSVNTQNDVGPLTQNDPNLYNMPVSSLMFNNIADPSSHHAHESESLQFSDLGPDPEVSSAKIINQSDGDSKSDKCHPQPLRSTDNNINIDLSPKSSSLRLEETSQVFVDGVSVCQSTDTRLPPPYDTLLPGDLWSQTPTDPGHLTNNPPHVAVAHQYYHNSFVQGPGNVWIPQRPYGNAHNQPQPLTNTHIPPQYQHIHGDIHNYQRFPYHHQHYSPHNQQYLQNHLQHPQNQGGFQPQQYGPSFPQAQEHTTPNGGYAFYAQQPNQGIHHQQQPLMGGTNINAGSIGSYRQDYRRITTGTREDVEALQRLPPQTAPVNVSTPRIDNIQTSHTETIHVSKS